MSLDRKINRIQFLSGNSLKVIAVLTMLIDHLCKIVLQWLLSNYWGAMADNGQKLKYFFYVFYPAHILVLYLIQIGLGKYLLK